MTILRIEHPTRDFATWKAGFDRDPAVRSRSGVQRYSIYQPVDNPRYVLIDLEFETVAQAEGHLAFLKQFWSSGAAGAAFGGELRTQILETMEVTELVTCGSRPATGTSNAAPLGRGRAAHFDRSSQA